MQLSFVPLYLAGINALPVPTIGLIEDALGAGLDIAGGVVEDVHGVLGLISGVLGTKARVINNVIGQSGTYPTKITQQTIPVQAVPQQTVQGQYQTVLPQDDTASAIS